MLLARLFGSLQFRGGADSLPEIAALRPAPGIPRHREASNTNRTGKSYGRIIGDGSSTRAGGLGGLGFAYLGPASAPLLSHWDLLVSRDSLRDIGRALIPCNWLQIIENMVDLSHVEWLHGRRRSAAAFPTSRALDLGVALSDRALLSGTARLRNVWDTLDSGEPAVALATMVTWC